MHRSIEPICQVIDDQVKLFHKSYPSYSDSRSGSVLPNDPHLRLLHRCLEYQRLVFSVWSRKASLEDEFRLVDYAVLHWPTHYLRCRDKLNGAKITVQFLNDAEVFTKWLELYTLHPKNRHRNVNFPTSPIEISSYFGFSAVVEHYLSTPLPKESYQRAMEFATERGEASILETLSKLGPFPQDLLRIASRHNQVECMKFLIAAGHDPNAFYGSEFSPFLEAACQGHTDAAIVMIENGADCNAVSMTQKLSSLQLASRIGNRELVEKLLHASANISSTDIRGYDALRYAAEGGFWLVVHKLLEHSAVMARNQTPDSMSQHDDKKYIDGEDNAGNTALHVAVRGGHSTVVKILLDKGANFETKNGIGYSPLHISCEMGFTKIFEQLMDAKSCKDTMSDALEAGPQWEDLFLTVSLAFWSWLLKVAILGLFDFSLIENLRSLEKNCSRLCFWPVSSDTWNRLSRFLSSIPNRAT